MKNGLLMRKILVMAALLVSMLSMEAQIVSFDMIDKNRNIDVKLTLRDAKTSEPISWASVYLIPQGDTTITHFSLSDEKGDVNLKEVPVGKYEVNAEMIGYLPYKKVHHFKSWYEDLGIIKMEENPEYLDAAKVSAAGNAIMIKQDTIIYNASSFKVGENDVLADLLKKMPGIEVGSDGSVTVNGEKVEKITVGGKTFFFNDPTAALNNLPAKIVDKIKVVDKEKDAASFSGVATNEDKEKVMDVELKEEYTKGWFGNAKAGGGTTLTPKSSDSLIDDRGMLYNGNAMVSGYTEKDQLVLIANAYNAVEPGADVAYISGSISELENDFSSMEGLNSSAQAGLNYSTDRIKGFETTAAVNYKMNAKDAASRSSRESFQNEGPNLYTDASYDGLGHDNSISVNMEIEKKDTKKFMVDFAPSVKFSRTDVTSSNMSRTFSSDADLNSSTSEVFSTSDNLTVAGWLSAGIKDLGKKKRSLTMNGGYSFAGADGTRKEFSEVIYGGSGTVKDLLYDNKMRKDYFTADLSYVEPFGKSWSLLARLSTQYIIQSTDKNAFNADGTANDYYTSFTHSRYVDDGGRLLLQYNNDTLRVQVGAMANILLNEVKAKSLGVETITGKGEWLTKFSPYASMRYRRDSYTIDLQYNGYSRQLSGSSITPNLDISNPTRITAGNIYLRPGFDHNLNLYYHSSNRERFSYFRISMYTRLSTDMTVHASWFDNSGIRYAVPVNSKKPQVSSSLYVSYGTPVDKERLFTFNTWASVGYSSSTSYQSLTMHESLDLDNFDYMQFMSRFWGNDDGNIFYSGQSGFTESSTRTLNWRVEASLKYNGEKLSGSIGARTSNRISRYSLDPSANVNTWSSRVGCDLIYTPGNDWEIKTDLKYRFYNGYAAGYGEPEWDWNMSVGKTIKSVTLALKVADILNQTHSFDRNISAEYVEDVYSKVMGRYFLFSVSFNFGKMNAKKNKRVEDAMWRSLW